MEETEFKLRATDDFIELNKLLKILGLAQTGGHAKLIIEEGLVSVNGDVELRKRKKLRSGDVVEMENSKISIK